jgi:hypothetical protein
MKFKIRLEIVKDLLESVYQFCVYSIIPLVVITFLYPGIYKLNLIITVLAILTLILERLLQQQLED